MTRPVLPYKPFISSEEQMHALMRNPAIRARILPYQLLADRMTPSTRWERFATWIAEIFFRSRTPQEGTAAHLRDRLIALRLNTAGVEEVRSKEEKEWLQRHAKDERAARVFLPEQTEVLVREVAEALEKRLDAVEGVLSVEDRIVQPGDWRAKRSLMATVVNLTNPSLSPRHGERIGQEIQQLYQRDLNEKVQLVAISGLQWILSLGIVNNTILPWLGISTDSPLARAGTIWATLQASMFASHQIKENGDFLPIRATIFGTNMFFLYKCFETMRPFANGMKAFAEIGFGDVMQVSTGVNVLMSYCPWKKLAARVSQAAGIVSSGYLAYLGLTGAVNAVQKASNFFFSSTSSA